MKPRIKPRNPFVASAKFRKAGPHEKSFKALRRQAAIALAKAMKVVPERQEKDISSKCSSLGTQILPLWRKWSARLSEEQEDAVRFGGEAPSFDGVCSVVACISDCDSEGTGSIPVEHPTN